MNDHKENLKLVEDLFVNNGEYNFKNEHKAREFVVQLLSRLESEYSEENYYREYEELSDFIRSHHADSTAFFLYQDNYEEQEA